MEDKLNQYSWYGVPRLSFNNWLCLIKVKHTYIYSKHFYRFFTSINRDKNKVYAKYWKNKNKKHEKSFISYKLNILLVADWASTQIYLCVIK